MKYALLLCPMLYLAAHTASAQTPAVAALLHEYATQGASTPDAEIGRRLWMNLNQGEAPFTQRACTSCHTKDLRQSGRHAKTNKPIEPMAPSVNSQRLTNKEDIEKWLLRNCKWTLGRECDPAEKANVLAFISAQ